MKNFLIAIVIVLTAGHLFAQNFQLHYDFGEDREYVTTTLEMFKPDEYGATFWFVDMDYNQQHNDSHRSISLSYLEIARYLPLPFSEKLSATVQYNDGNTVAKAPSGNILEIPLGPIWLFGVSYPVQMGSVVLNTDILYRNAFDSDGPDAQFTTVWFENFLDGRISFAGFLDIWSQDDSDGSGKMAVVMTEPQLWYNFGDHLSLGSEFELSVNFIPGTEGLQVMPTLGMKWQF